jgi:hypothetical protein
MEPTASVKVKGIPELIQEQRTDPNLALFKASASGIAVDTIPGLIARIQTTMNPLTLWLIHLDLDRRGVPPGLRWPARLDHPQMRYITWLADILWLRRRYPSHPTSYNRWRGLFIYRPHCVQWHQTALWVHSSKAAGQHGQGHYFARGLGLTDDQRQEVMTVPTNTMRANRKLLVSLPDFKLKMTRYLAARPPDKSGTWSAQDVAERLSVVLKTNLLANRNKTRGCAYYEFLVGVKVARQTYVRLLHRLTFATGRSWI